MFTLTFFRLWLQFQFLEVYSATVLWTTKFSEIDWSYPSVSMKSETINHIFHEPNWRPIIHKSPDLLMNLSIFPMKKRSISDCLHGSLNLLCLQRSIMTGFISQLWKNVNRTKKNHRMNNRIKAMKIFSSLTFGYCDNYYFNANTYTKMFNWPFLCKFPISF